MRCRLAFVAACALACSLAWFSVPAAQVPPAGAQRPPIRRQPAMEKLQPRAVPIEDLKTLRVRWNELKDSDVVVVQGRRVPAGDYRKLIREYQLGLARQARSTFVRNATAARRTVQGAGRAGQPGRVQALNREIAARMTTAGAARAPFGGGPRIASIYPDTAVWGDPILISGSGFQAAQGGITVLKPGTGPGGVHMVLPDPHQQVAITSWSDTAIVVTAPNTGVNQFLHWSLAVRTSDGKQSQQVAVTITPPLDYLYMCPWGPSADTTEQCADMPWPFSPSGTLRVCSPCTSFSKELKPEWNDQTQGYETPANPFVHVMNVGLKQDWVVDDIRFDCTYFEETGGDCHTSTPFGDMPTPCYQARACDKNKGAWIAGAPNVGMEFIRSVAVGWKIPQPVFGWHDDYVAYAGLIVLKGPKGTKPF